jgi:predicted nucleotidyltransferase component of viral defense system
MADETDFHWHEDPDLFREAVTFTAAETGFAARLVEKDYFCTVLLRYLTASGIGLVFRGGTCLAKVHSGFYRLSEDLDFLIPMAVDSSRPQRRREIAPVKEVVTAIADYSSGFSVVRPLTGANQSTQYVAEIAYESVLSDSNGTVKIEVGLREPLLTPQVEGAMRTLLLDPISNEPSVPLTAQSCVSRDEAMAEKLRAALTRREVAIRDYYDVDYAHRSGFSLLEPRLLDLVREKLAIPGNDPIDVSPARLEALKRQREAQLEPVLRPSDYSAFDLDRAAATVRAVANAIGPAP